MNGNAGADGQVQHLAHLLGLRLGKGAADHGEILGGHGHPAAIDAAQADHHSIAGETFLVQAKGAVAVGDVGVHLLKAAGIEQAVDPLPGREFAFGVLALDGLCPASLPHLLPAAEHLGV